MHSSVWYRVWYEHGLCVSFDIVAHCQKKWGARSVQSEAQPCAMKLHQRLDFSTFFLGSLSCFSSIELFNILLATFIRNFLNFPIINHSILTNTGNGPHRRTLYRFFFRLFFQFYTYFPYFLQDELTPYGCLGFKALSQFSLLLFENSGVKLWATKASQCSCSMWGILILRRFVNNIKISISHIKSCKCGFECCKQPSSFHFYMILMLIAKYVIFPYLIQNIFFVRFHFRSSPIFYTNWNHPTNDDSYITDKTFAFFPNWLTSSIPTNRSWKTNRDNGDGHNGCSLSLVPIDQSTDAL